MSFSSEVKSELEQQIGNSRHCQLAELAAFVQFAGRIRNSEGQTNLQIHAEYTGIAKKCYYLIKRAFPDAHIKIESNCMVNVAGEDARRVLQAVKLLDVHGAVSTTPELVDGLLVQKTCCKRAYIRGAYLLSGSMSDPNKSYHFEIVCDYLAQAEQICEIMREFVPDAKVLPRKKHFIVYLKEGSQIVDILNVMEAHVALMNLENVRIIKEMRNSVNRQVNCETANINKTVNAAVRQLEDIRLIARMKGLDTLPDNLREIAELRMEYPETPLKELGEMLEPPVGKSGVNHRFRKINEIAEMLR